MVMITKLEMQDIEEKKIRFQYESFGYYDVKRSFDGFSMEYAHFDGPVYRWIEDELFYDENCLVYGAYENNVWIGYAQAIMDKHQRFVIDNIAIFDPMLRHKGLGSQFLRLLISVAKVKKARMITVNLSSANEKAIAFYRKHGFDFIGLDLYHTSNVDPLRHDVTILMGKPI